MLTKSLVNEALEWDTKDNLQRAPKDRSNTHIPDLEKCVNECDISFNVWEKKNADGKGSNIYDFISLMGSEKKLLLKHLPEELRECINANHRDSVIKLWKVFLKF